MDASVVLIGVLLAAMATVWLAALIDASIQPDGAWRAVGRRRTGWIVRLLLFGWIAGVVYFLSVRPGLRAAVKATVRPPPAADGPT